jgi:putative oxidoreductase
MRRFFSTFARGRPGLGLLLMRLVARIALLIGAVNTFRVDTFFVAALPQITAAGAGVLLLVGLWTPITATLATILQIWAVFAPPHDPLSHILLATLSADLALIGTGAWSVDARLFGWKRIDIQDQRR